MTKVKEVYIGLGLDSKRLSKDIKKANSTLKTGLKDMIGFLAPILGLSALSGSVKQYSNKVNELAKTSKMLGESVEDLQAWRGAIESVGGSADAFENSAKAMNKALHEAIQFGGGGIVEVFKKINVSATDANGRIRASTDIFLELASASERLTKQEFSAYGQMLGFDSSMITLLSEGGTEVMRLLKVQKELAAYSKKDAELAQKSKLAFTGFGKSLEGVTAILHRAVIPSLIFFTENLTDLSIWVRDNETFVLTFFSILASILFMAGIPAMKAFATATWAAMAPFLPFIAVALAVALAIDDLRVYLQGGESALGSFWKKMENVGAFKVFINMWSGLKNTFFGILNLLKSISELIGGIFTLDSSKILSSFLKIKDSIKEIVDGILEFFNIDGIKSFFGFGDDDDDPTKPKPTGGGGSPASYPIYPQEALVAASTSTSNSTSNKNINSSINTGDIIIQTNATDSQGIANSINPAIENTFGNNLAYLANSGVSD